MAALCQNCKGRASSFLNLLPELRKKIYDRTHNIFFFDNGFYNYLSGLNGQENQDIQDYLKIKHLTNGGKLNFEEIREETKLLRKEAKLLRKEAKQTELGKREIEMRNNVLNHFEDVFDDWIFFQKKVIKDLKKAGKDFQTQEKRLTSTRKSVHDVSDF